MYLSCSIHRVIVVHSGKDYHASILLGKKNKIVLAPINPKTAEFAVAYVTGSRGVTSFLFFLILPTYVRPVILAYQLSN